MNNARYDVNSRQIIVSIPDPNLYLELQNFIEESGGYVETQLNGKLLQIRAEYFIALAVLNEDSENQKKVIKQIEKYLKINNKEEKNIEPKYLGKELINIGVNVTTIIANISSLFSPANTLASSLLSIIK